MNFPFIGRVEYLARFEQLMNADEGSSWFIDGAPGIGKSTLLEEFGRRCEDRKRPWLLLNVKDLVIQNGLELLLTLAQGAQQLPQLWEAAGKVAGYYKAQPDMVGLLGDAGEAAVQAIGGESAAAKTAGSAIPLITGLFNRRAERERLKEEAAIAANAELYLLQALEAACRKRPVILVDTFEHLLRNQQEISSRVRFVAGTAKGDTPAAASLTQWLHQLIEHLAKRGARVMVAGRDFPTGFHPKTLPNFDDEEMLQGARGNERLAAAAEDPVQSQYLLKVLERLSFDGNPLWLRVGINLLEQLLAEGRDLAELARDEETLRRCFEEPGVDYSGALGDEHASCKLALLGRITSHVEGVQEKGWRIALPHYLDKEILGVLFGEEAQAVREAYQFAGVFTTGLELFTLHEHIRDLLLAAARHRGSLADREIYTVHQRLAGHFEELGAEADNDGCIHWRVPRFALEAAYHKLMGDPRLITKGVDVETLWNNLGTSYYYSAEQKWEIAEKLSGWSFPQLEELEARCTRERQYSEAQLGIAGAQRLRQWLVTGRLNGLKDIQTNIEFWKQETQHNDNPNAWYFYGCALRESNRLTEAETAFQRQLEITHDHHSCWYDLGVVLKEQEKFGNAISAYQKQLKINPNHKDAWNNLGVLLAQQESTLAEAETALRQQLEVVPNHKYAWSNLGLTLTKLSRPKEAESAYRKQLELDPDHEKTWNNLAILLQNQQRMEEAEAAYRKQLEVKPDHENARNNLGLLLWQGGRTEEAAKVFEEAIKTDPDDLSVLANDAELALVQKDRQRCLLRVKAARNAAKANDQRFVILPFLAWLAEPGRGWSPVLEALDVLEESTEFTWDFSDIAPVVEELEERERQAANLFINHFQGRIDRAALEEGLGALGD